MIKRELTSIERTQLKRIVDYRKSQIEKWDKSIPKAFRNYHLDDHLPTNWDGHLTKVHRRNVENYLDKPTKFLILTGGAGVGKSAMASSICRDLLDRGMVNSALYYDYPRLMEDMSFNRDDPDLYRARKTGILFLDDVGAGSVGLTDTRKQGIWGLINNRWAHDSYTIMTTNMPVNRQDSSDGLSLIEFFGETAWDRISDDLTVIPFKGGSFRGGKNRIS